MGVEAKLEIDVSHLEDEKKALEEKLADQKIEIESLKLRNQELSNKLEKDLENRQEMEESNEFFKGALKKSECETENAVKISKALEEKLADQKIEIESLKLRNQHLSSKLEEDLENRQEMEESNAFLKGAL